MIKKALRLLVAAAVPVAGTLAAAEPARSEPVTVELVTEQTSIRPGEEFWVGVHLKLDDGWHTYWKNPGDAGAAVSVDWDLPEGFTVSDVQWPHPSRFEENALVGFGYDQPVTLLAKVTPPAALTVGKSVDIGASVRYVACKDRCIPGSENLKITIPVLATAPKADPQHAALFTSARAMIPRQVEHAVAVVEGESIVLNLDVPARSASFSEGYFFPEPELAGVFDYGAAQKLTKTDDGWALTLSSADMAGVAAPLSGVVVLSTAEGSHSLALEVDTLMDTAGAQVAAVASGGMGLWAALGLAFAGGLLLNLMPCVLPVISLKILSFVNLAGSDRRQIFRHGVVFTLGVLISFWAIAAVLLALRAYGASLGWGFQLQEPIFLVILMMILFALSLSLLGVFEFGTSLVGVGANLQNKKKGLMASFLSGILATLVATPCTGPFMAPAIGYAVTLPSLAALLIFTLMGLGMSMPYLVMAAFPKLVNRLPKPGPWMIVFKQLMGFFMMAVVLWLVWVFAAQVASTTAIVILLGSLLVLATGAWVYGRWGNIAVKKGKRYVGYAATVLLLGAALVVGVRATKEEVRSFAQVEQGEYMAGEWAPWDPERFKELRAQGVPVFVDFTAKWCLICQTNKVPLGKEDVRREFKQKGVVMMEADWTKRDPVITEELEKFGRNGVPLYVLYSDDAEPQVLPQLLTPAALKGALEKLHDD